VASKIRDCLDNYSERAGDFESYRNGISSQKEQFESEVKNIFGIKGKSKVFKNKIKALRNVSKIWFYIFAILSRKTIERFKQDALLALGENNPRIVCSKPTAGFAEYMKVSYGDYRRNSGARNKNDNLHSSYAHYLYSIVSYYNIIKIYEAKRYSGPLNKTLNSTNDLVIIDASRKPEDVYRDFTDADKSNSRFVLFDRLQANYKKVYRPIINMPNAREIFRVYTADGAKASPRCIGLVELIR